MKLFPIRAIPRPQRSPTRRILLVALCLFAVACDGEDRPATTPAAPEVQGSEATLLEMSPLQDAPGQNDIPPRTPVVDVSLTAEGSFQPGAPITVSVDAHARLSASAVNVKLVFPEVEAARRTEFGAGYWASTNAAIPEHASWLLGSMARGQRHTRSNTLDIPAPGYYRVLAIADAQPQGLDSDRSSHRIKNWSLDERWLLITGEGGMLTDTFQKERIPEGMYQQPGPFRSNGSAERATPEEAGLLGSLFSLARKLMFGSDIDVHVQYYDSDNTPAGFSPAIHATLHADLYDGDPLPENFVRHEEEVVGTDGIVTLTCEGSLYQWDVWAEYEDAEVFHPGVHGQDQIYGCTDSVQIETPWREYEAFRNLDVVIPDIDSYLGQGRSAIEFKVDGSGCSGGTSCYHKSPDVIEFTTDGAMSDLTAAHEYGHAIHHESLGGIWEASNCSPHSIDSISSYKCALKEGFADYMGAVGTNGGPYDWYEDFDAGITTDSTASIEGHVAALLHDLTDDDIDGNDSTYYSGSYIAAVFEDCITWIDSNWYAMNAADQLVWCLENRVNLTVQNNEFPGRSDWDDAEEQASEPGSWDADDMRATWLQNIGN